MLVLVSFLFSLLPAGPRRSQGVQTGERGRSEQPRAATPPRLHTRRPFESSGQRLPPTSLTRPQNLLPVLINKQNASGVGPHNRLWEEDLKPEGAEVEAEAGARAGAWDGGGAGE